VCLHNARPVALIAPAVPITASPRQSACGVVPVIGPPRPGRCPACHLARPAGPVAEWRGPVTRPELPVAWRGTIDRSRRFRARCRSDHVIARRVPLTCRARPLACRSRQLAVRRGQAARPARPASVSPSSPRVSLATARCARRSARRSSPSGHRPSRSRRRARGQPLLVAGVGGCEGRFVHMSSPAFAFDQPRRLSVAERLQPVEALWDSSAQDARDEAIRLFPRAEDDLASALHYHRTRPHASRTGLQPCSAGTGCRAASNQ
jgi:hypothetical protein